MTLKDTTVLVLGLGASGLAMAQWCAREGAQVRVADSRELPPQAAALAERVPGATLHVGFDPSLLDGVQRVFKSPGLSPIEPALQPLLARAAELGVPVQGELDLFAQALAALKAERGYAPKLIAITGTNGKTTTTMMCGHLVARSGARVAVAGNVGPTMLDTLAAALELEPAPLPLQEPSPQPSPADAGEGANAPLPSTDAGEGAIPSLSSTDAGEGPLSVSSSADAEEGVRSAPSPASAGEGRGEGDSDAPLLTLIPPPPAAPVFEHLPEVWVLELSSFQLDSVQGFVPSAAVALNLTQDHLDWHGSMAAYAAAKARVYGANSGPPESIDTVAIVNRDDAQAEALLPVPAAAAKAVGKGRGVRVLAPAARRVIRFGLGAPRAPGDYGLVIENGMAWMVRALEADATLKRRRSDTEDGSADELHLQRLMPADALRIRGRHNVANALAALALATAIGRPLAPMLHGLREYRGEPHRVEFIATVAGIEAYDDSKGTNVGATVAALDGLGADRAPLRLAVILGGDGKGQDFAPLAAPVARHARAVALIGRDAEAIRAAIAPSAAAAGVPIESHATLEAATAWCFAQARPGDAVLLSPACASFDMFSGYAHRAQVFNDAVRSLAAERGEAA